MYETDYVNIMNQTGMGAGQGAATGGGNGALIGGAMGLLSGITQEGMNSMNSSNQLHQQNDLNAIQMSWMKEAMRFQSAQQYEMWLKTNYPAQVEQMKKAGLNPALIYKSAGGGGVTGNVSAGSVEGGKASDESSRRITQNQAMGLALQANMQNAQIENMKADTALKLATAEKTSGVDTEVARTSITNMLADIDNKQVQNIGYKLDNQLKDIELLVSGSTAQIRIDKLARELDYSIELLHQIKTNNSILDATKDAIITKAYADMENSIKDLSLKDAQINKLKTEIDLMIDRFEWDKIVDTAQIRIGLYNAENGRVKNAIESAYLELEKKGTQINRDSLKLKTWELIMKTITSTTETFYNPAKTVKHR